jgi:glycosylphosphatidylinositol transamidase
MMTRGLSLGLPSGNHGLFLRFGIPAATLHGFSNSKHRTSVTYMELGRAIEGMARCLNNLLERFHQSFFFYLLPASHRYISIGLYFGPFAAMTLALVVKALAIWLLLPNRQREKKKEEKEDKDGKGDEKTTPVTTIKEETEVRNIESVTQLLLNTCFELC